MICAGRWQLGAMRHTAQNAALTYRHVCGCMLVFRGEQWQRGPARGSEGSSRLAEVVEECRQIAIPGIGLVPDSGDLAAVEPRRHQRRHARTWRTDDVSCSAANSVLISITRFRTSVGISYRTRPQRWCTINSPVLGRLSDALGSHESFATSRPNELPSNIESKTPRPTVPTAEGI